MKKHSIFSKIILFIWLFGSIFLILVDKVYALNTPLQTLTSPIWFPISIFVLADLINMVFVFLKDYFKKK